MTPLLRRSRAPTPDASPFQQQHPHYSDVWQRTAATGPPSSRLQAFGGGGGGFGNFNNVKPPIENWKDIVQRIQELVTASFRQFVSAFFTGYLAGSAWGLIRGPSVTGVNRGLALGLDFGILSAIFSLTTGVTQLILALPSKKKETKKDDDSSSSAMNKQQKVSLWSVVIRNMILSLYFTRAKGAAKMAQFACLYGGATYYFVSQKAKRMSMFQQSGMGGMGGMPGMGGMGGMGGMPGMGGMGGGAAGQPSAVAMQQILQQIMASQQAASMGTQPASPKNNNQSTSTKASGYSSTTQSTPPPSSPKKSEKPKGDIVDVEWESEPE